jgi:hypothetical protein
MCNFLICEAFENTKNVIYIPYWTDTHVLSVVSYCYQHCISLHNVWTLFSKIALSKSFVHYLLKWATIVNLMQLSFQHWISWLTFEHACFIFRRSWNSFLCLDVGYTDRFSMFLSVPEVNARVVPHTRAQPHHCPSKSLFADHCIVWHFSVRYWQCH